MTKVNLNNGIETKSDIFPWYIFKSDSISFLSKDIKVFQWLSISEFLSFMTKVNPNNGNERKADIFRSEIFKSDTCFIETYFKYFNDFQNWNFSILWLEWTQAMKMKQNQTFFQASYSNLTLFSLVLKYYDISITFIIDIFQFHCKIEHNQVKWNKITWDLCKSDSIFFYLQSSKLLKWLLKFISCFGLSKEIEYI